MSSGMETLSPSLVASPPFGKIKFWRMPDGSKRIRASWLVETPFEGGKFGLAIDGSASMRGPFGLGGLLGFLAGQRSGTNVVSPEAQKMCAYLARLDVDGKVAAIYWATGKGGDGIEVIGDLTEAEAQRHIFAGPKHYGDGTRLEPALRYFVDRFAQARWGTFVFITDGKLEDLDAVKRLTTQLAQDTEAKRRNPIKLAMIGVGKDVSEAQMIALDDLETGTNQDLWDHKIAAEMRDVQEIFAEVVDDATIIADSGSVLDANGNLVKSYKDTGLPALLEFTLPASGASAFIVEVGGQMIKQSMP